MKTGLYVQDPDTVIRVEAEAIRVERSSGSTRVPLENIEQLVLSERTVLTGPAMGLLRERGISVCWVDWRGRLLGRLEPLPSKNAVMRRSQVECANDPGRTMVLARAMVRAKIRNQRVFLQRHVRRGGEISEALLNKMMECEGDVVRTQDRMTLMGVEGSAAKLYFEGIGVLLEGTGFVWSGRSRNPPRDAVNAMLSFGYVLLSGDCADAAALAGLDPYVGFLHAEKAGRADLAMDLMEELRAPVVDSLVMSLIRKKSVRPDEFEVGEDGVLMSEATRKRFLVAWSEAKAREVQHPLLGTTHRMGVFPLIQARLLGKACAGWLPEYIPFIWR